MPHFLGEFECKLDAKGANDDPCEPQETASGS